MIYLDHNATTPVLPEVFESMLPYFFEDWGNPSSTYRFGSKVKRAIETAREQVAELIGAHPAETIFTSSGTESDNTAIDAILHADDRKRHLITSSVEHSAVLCRCRSLERSGFRITYLPVDSGGRLTLPELAAAIRPDTAGVSLMWANNETGVVFPVAEVAALCQSRGLLFHCDAVQAAGKVPIDLRRLPIDYLTLTGHKIGAPKGVGVLFVRGRAPFTPLLCGGHQERGRRGGTECVPLIAAIGTAASLAITHLPKYDRNLRSLRDALEFGILDTVRGSQRNGDPDDRLSNTSNIHFPGIDSEAHLLLLDQAGICASSGSACLADSPDPSHVISAMKPGPAAHESIRFSLGVQNNITEIQEAIKNVRGAVASLAN